MTNYKEILAKYKFTDEIGHPLENCQVYLDLLAESRKAARESRKAARAERKACLQIVIDYENLHPSTYIEKYQIDGIVSAIRARDEKAV